MHTSLTRTLYRDEWARKKVFHTLFVKYKQICHPTLSERISRVFNMWYIEKDKGTFVVPGLRRSGYRPVWHLGAERFNLKLRRKGRGIDIITFRCGTVFNIENNLERAVKMPYRGAMCKNRQKGPKNICPKCWHVWYKERQIAEKKRLFEARRRAGHKRYMRLRREEKNDVE